MGFIWRTIDGDIEDLDSSEIRNNIDDVLTDIQTSWSWTDISGVSEDVLANDALELRSAVDFADQQNYCRSDHISHWNTARFDVDVGYDATHHPGHLIGYLAGYDASLQVSYWPGHYPGHLNDYHGTYRGAHYPTYYGTNHPTNNGTLKDGYLATNPTENFGCPGGSE